MRKVSTAYILWLGGLFGLAGLHRLYNGEIRTGLLWLCTFGFGGLGQLLDLMLIPKMVEVHNDRLIEQSFAAVEQKRLASLAERMPHSASIVELLKAAEARGGKLSVTQGVMATGLSFTQVEALLGELLKSGYVDIGNDPETGVVLYEFHEL